MYIKANKKSQKLFALAEMLLQKVQQTLLYSVCASDMYCMRTEQRTIAVAVKNLEKTFF